MCKVQVEMDLKLTLVSVVFVLFNHIQVFADRNESSADFSPESDANGVMRGWVIREYGGINALEFNDSLKIPTLKSNTDVLIEVIATSVNPLDQLMTAGYGKRALNELRNLNSIDEFPLILGRDFSGVVKAKGIQVRDDIKIGDKVFGVSPVHQPGALAEYVVVDQENIVHKPQNIDDIGAAGVMFAGLTAWSSFYLSGYAGGFFGAFTSGGGGKGLRVCILGASGGVGTLAVQMAKAEEMIVTATCGTDSVQMVKELGADHVIDYRKEDLKEAFRGLSFDIILDAAGLGPDYATTLPWSYGQYITLQPPVANNTDSSGLLLGTVKSAINILESNIQAIFHNRGLLKWGFFVTESQGIEYLRRQVESGKIKPIIDTIYEFNATKEAFDKVAKGHLRGKIIIKVKND